MPEMMLSYMRQMDALNDRINEGYLETANLEDCQEYLGKAKILLVKFREHEQEVLANLMDESARQALTEANTKTREKYEKLKEKLEARILELQESGKALQVEVSSEANKAETKEKVLGSVPDEKNSVERDRMGNMSWGDAMDDQLLQIKLNKLEENQLRKERLQLELLYAQQRLEENHRLLFNTPMGEEDVLGESAFLAKLKQEAEKTKMEAPSASIEEAVVIVNARDRDEERSSQARFPDIQLKLDKISLPTFSGDYLEWLAFRDQFRDLIHKSPRLDDMVKFHQLRTHLKGSAYEVIRGYSFTAMNYKSAWDDLNRRFNREDTIIEEYIRRFIDIPRLREEGGVSQYTSMMDITRQMLQALPNFHIKVEAWGPMMKYILISKFDANTKKEWRMHIGKEQQVPLEKLLDFLDVLAFRLHDNERKFKSKFGRSVNAVASEPWKRTNQQINQVSLSAGPSVNTENGACRQCKGIHPLYECGELKGLRAAQRTEKIRELDLCFKCLGKHPRGECRLRNGCPTCGGPHNSFLCYKKERMNDKRKKEAEQSVNHA